jgi:hypothetical protein
MACKAVLASRRRCLFVDDSCQDRKTIFVARALFRWFVKIRRARTLSDPRPEKQPPKSSAAYCSGLAVESAVPLETARITPD